MMMVVVAAGAAAWYAAGADGKCCCLELRIRLVAELRSTEQAAACCCFGMIRRWTVDKDYMGDRLEFGALELGFVKTNVDAALVETIAAGTERMVVVVAAAKVAVGEKDFAFELFAAVHSVVAQVAGAGYAVPEVEVEVEVDAESYSMCLDDFECTDLGQLQAAAKVALCGEGFDQ